MISVLALRRAGSETQQQQLLPGIGSGELIVVPAWLERDGGYGAEGVQLAATRTQGGYRLQGVEFARLAARRPHAGGQNGDGCRRGGFVVALLRRRSRRG